jgi:hypothetical protein
MRLAQPNITRRQLLAGALATTAAVPFLNADRARGQEGEFPTRLVVFATPNGTRNQLFWPTVGAGGLNFPELTAPLREHASDLVFLDGIRHCPAVVGDNGFAGGLNGSEHARGMGGLLTARPLGMGSFQSFMATSGWGSGISLDQHLGQILDLPTRFKTLELGVHVRDTQVRGRICYRGADQPVPPREDPQDVFNALFASDGGVSSDELSRLHAERKSVFDITTREIARLQGRLGADDRAKLQAHLDSIRDIEGRLTESDGSPPDLTQCVVPEGDFLVDRLSDSNLEVTGKLQMDLAAAALACDQTRIVTIQWNYAESEHLFPFLGLSRNHHAISHDWQGTQGFLEYGMIHVWYAEQLAYFLSKLSSYTEGEGTLLDNTIVFWGTEIGESTQHDLTRMPYVLAGGAHRGLGGGRLIDYKSNPKDNNQLLVSLAKLMGAEDMEQFGDPSGATGTLSGLV